jgi:hypothetical protein
MNKESSWACPEEGQNCAKKEEYTDEGEIKKKLNDIVYNNNHKGSGTLLLSCFNVDQLEINKINQCKNDINEVIVKLENGDINEEEIYDKLNKMSDQL